MDAADLRIIQEQFARHSVQPPGRAPRDETEQIAESVALALLFLASFLENGTICTVLVQASRRRTVPNQLLLSLAVANFFLSILVTPFVLASVIADQWVFGSAWCEASGFLMNFLFNASNFSAASIAVYRYYLVVKPLAVKFNLPRAQRMMGFVWMTSLVFALPPLLGWNMYQYSPGKAYCTVTWHSTVPGLVFTTFHACVTFVAPASIILFVYRVIYTRAKKQRKRTGYNNARGLSANGLCTSSYSLDNQHLLCGCFPRCVAVHENSDCYSRKNTEVVPSMSSNSLSFESSSQTSPIRQTDDAPNIVQRRISKHISRHSLIIQHRTFQSASAIVISFIVCTTPYFILNLHSSFSRTTPHYVIDFVTSWLYLSLTAIHPITYGHSNRYIRRAVARVPVLRALFSARLQVVSGDTRVSGNGHTSGVVLRNEAVDFESTS